jgi:hypothetical protein
MSSKKKTTANPNLQTLRIGTRVRCTDDGVEGRISWANAVSVKIKWDDGEEVTWKRDSLAGKPIEFLDADAASEEEQVEAPTASEESAPAELPCVDLETPLATAKQAPATEASVAELAPQAQEQALAQEPQAAPADSGTEPALAPEKPKR